MMKVPGIFKITASVLLVLVLTLLAFLPSLGNDFVNWDDPLYIARNPAIKSPGNIGKIFSSFIFYNYQPLTLLSYSLDYRLFRLDPFGYHLTNLILHLFNSGLVFWLVLLLGRRIVTALITALLFGCHPLHVESVAWVSGRKDVLYALFFLAALISYLYYLRAGRRSKYYYLSLAFFCLSLLSKAMAVTLPLVLLLVDYFVRRREGRPVFSDKVPFFALSLIYGGITVLAQYSEGGVRQFQTFGLFDKFSIAAYSVLFYLGKMIAPVKLSCLYPRAWTPGQPPLSFLLSLLVMVAAGTVLCLRRGFSRKIVFSSLFFLITVLPVLQFIPIGHSIVADRYIYIPSLGIFYGIGEALGALYDRRSGVRKVLFWVVLAGVFAGLATLTWQRCRVWKNSLTLWSDALAHYPDTRMAYLNRGVYFLGVNEFGKAESDLRQGIALRPEDRSQVTDLCYFNLANLLCRTGRVEEGIGIFKKLIRSNPGDAHSYIGIADAYATVGRHEEAMIFYRKAAEMDPGLDEAVRHLGNEYWLRGDTKEAERLYLKALQIDPDDVKTYEDLALLYGSLGKNEEIISLYKKAVTHRAAYFDAYYQTARLAADAGRKKEAVELYEKALRIDPGSVAAAINLGNAYCDMGRNREGIGCYEKALELVPASPDIYHNLALAYADEGKYDQAARCQETATKLGYRADPEFLSWLRRQGGN